MFNQTTDQRISSWINLRSMVEEDSDPLQLVWNFWHQCPFIPYNKNVDPYYQKNWPTPWEIIAHNKYDDFTKALMIAWTLKLTKKFENSHIDIRIMIDDKNNKSYNIVFVDEIFIINFDDNGPVNVENLNDSLKLENIIEIDRPR